MVCTLNRADSLRRTLASLVALRPPPAGFEVVVVDNGSRDHTAAVVHEVAADHPLVRYVHEPELGLSVARNRGVAESRGRIVAFLDDDAEAGPAWLLALVDAFDDASVGGVGGRIALVFATGRPPWLPDRLVGYYSGLELGDERRPFVLPECPYGTNMALRRDVFDAVGGFATDLGRRGGSLLSNEEVDLFYRVRDTGAAIVYEPAALVHHHVEPARAQRGYFLRRAFAQGRSRARFDAHLHPGRDRDEWVRKAAAAGWTGVRRGAAEAAAAATDGDSRAAGLMSAASRVAVGLGFAVEAARLTRSR